MNGMIISVRTAEDRRFAERMRQLLLFRVSDNKTDACAAV